MNPFVIRSYSAKDFEQVVILFRANTPEFFSTQEETDLIQYLKNETEDYFVIEKENQVIGSGGINYSNQNSIGIISWDIIDPKHQGLGIGLMLLNHRLHLLKNKSSIQKIIVRTSQVVFPFYEKAGFELIEVKTDYWAKGFDLYLMEINS
ncbi:MAG: GNAT family N-acetyltransferase [Flavobacteriales bacterium]|nr:GNAT family N-acetyltransferase [Flavobacteriales bacterium]